MTAPLSTNARARPLGSWTMPSFSHPTVLPCRSKMGSISAGPDPVAREYLSHSIDRNRFHRSAFPAHGGRAEQRVVDRFLSGFNDCLVERRKLFGVAYLCRRNSSGI